MLHHAVLGCDATSVIARWCCAASSDFWKPDPIECSVVVYFSILEMDVSGATGMYVYRGVPSRTISVDAAEAVSRAFFKGRGEEEWLESRHGQTATGIHI